MNPEYEPFGWLRHIAGTSGVLGPGLCLGRGHKNPPRPLVVSTPTSSISVTPHLAHRAIFIRQLTAMRVPRAEYLHKITEGYFLPFKQDNAECRKDISKRSHCSKCVCV